MVSSSACLFASSTTAGSRWYSSSSSCLNNQKRHVYRLGAFRMSHHLPRTWQQRPLTAFPDVNGLVSKSQRRSGYTTGSPSYQEM
jgi:hypothetical protein